MNNKRRHGLRVLVWHWGRRGGGPRYTLELTRALAHQGDIEIHLSLSRQSEIYDDFSDIPVAGRFDVDTYTSLAQFALRSLALPLLRLRFLGYLKRAGIDIVFCTMDHLWNSFIVGAIRPAGCIYLLTVHDAIRHPGEAQSWRQWLLRQDVAASDGALVLTKSVCDLLVLHHSYPRERTFLSTLGVHSYGSRSKPRALPVDRSPRLLFFGRILEYKGLDTLLVALPRLQVEFPGLTLEVWGSGDIRPYRRYLALLNGVRMENRWIGEGEIERIFADTDLAILPYREASQSGVVATAFADGMPCITTPIPGLTEQVTQGVSGVVAASLGAEDLAEAIAKPLRDRDLYQRLSQGALESANTTLNWQSIGGTVSSALFRLHRLGHR